MGFRFEGVLREAHVVDGERRDIVLMALLRSEFEELTRGGDAAPD
jgi:RimJ/RimL family protein N-acetyltransferase